MTWQDFWGTIFPAYLGAVGSIAASAVAVAAFIRDMRTRAGLREVAQSAASTIEIPSSRAADDNLVNAPTVMPPGVGTPVRDAPAGEPRLELTTHRNQTVLRNLTAEPIQITGLRVPSAGKTLTLRSEFPGVVQPGEGFGFIVHDHLGGPAIAALLVEWIDGTGTARLSRFFI